MRSIRMFVVYGVLFFTPVLAHASTLAWSVGTGGTIRASSGSATWVGQPSGTTTQLNDVVFTDAGHGWVAGTDGIVYRTTDGGANWIASPVISASPLVAIDFVNNTTGFVVSETGQLYRTTDGGLTFAPPINLGVHFYRRRPR